jgi:hypothetical protein
MSTTSRWLLIEDLMTDFQNALELAETDEQRERARDATKAAQALRRAIMALVAAPGAED